jgi:hypothetical protein
MSTRPPVLLKRFSEALFILEDGDSLSALLLVSVGSCRGGGCFGHVDRHLRRCCVYRVGRFFGIAQYKDDEFDSLNVKCKMNKDFSKKKSANPTAFIFITCGLWWGSRFLELSRNLCLLRQSATFPRRPVALVFQN